MDYRSVKIISKSSYVCIVWDARINAGVQSEIGYFFSSPFVVFKKPVQVRGGGMNGFARVPGVWWPSGKGTANFLLHWSLLRLRLIVESITYVTITTGMTRLLNPPCSPLLQVFLYLPPCKKKGTSAHPFAWDAAQYASMVAPSKTAGFHSLEEHWLLEMLVLSGHVSASALQMLSSLWCTLQTSNPTFCNLFTQRLALLPALTFTSHDQWKWPTPTLR